MKTLGCACILTFSNGNIWETNDSSVINDITGIAANASAGETLQAYLPQTSDLLSNMLIPTGSFDSSATAPAQSPSIEECISVITSGFFWYFVGLFSRERFPLIMAKLLATIYSFNLTTFFGRKKALMYSVFETEPPKSVSTLQDAALIALLTASLALDSFTSYVIVSTIILGPSFFHIMIWL